jgi:hypothetical protein
VLTGGPFVIPDTLQPTNAVIPWLLDRLPNRKEGGYVVYCDNLFTNTKLCSYLLSHNYGCCGTCRTNSGINKKLVEKKKEWKHNPSIPWGEILQMPSVDTHTLHSVWQDSAPTLMLSTVHQPICMDPALIDREELQERPIGEKIGPRDEYTVRQRTRHRNNTTVQEAFPDGIYTRKLEMPSLYADYNDNMDGIDVFDHLRSTNPMHRRQCLGGWRALFNFLITVPLVNSYLLSGFRSTVPPLLQSEFRRQLILALLYRGEDLTKCKRKQPGARARPNSERQHQDISHQFGKRLKLSVCRYCNSAPEPRMRRKVLGDLNGNIIPRKLIRKRSIWGCISCNIATCKEGDCFKKHCNKE